MPNLSNQRASSSLYVLDVAPHTGGQIKCGSKGLQMVGLFQALALNGICVYTYYVL